MMVIFLCGLVAVILLRTLRADFARYAKEDELDIEGMHGTKDDSGWKMFTGTFRALQQLVLFSASWQQVAATSYLSRCHSVRYGWPDIAW